MNRFVLCAIFLLAASVPSSVWSDDDNKKTTGDDKTDRKMVELQKKSKSIKTCAAQVSTIIRIEDQEVTISGPGFFKGPGKMRIEKSLPDGSAQLVINDGSYLWIHDETENLVSRINLARVYQVTKIEADADQFDPLRPFRGIDWSTIRYTGDVTVAGAVHAIFEAKPLPTLLFAQLPSPPARVILNIHEADGLLRQARIYDAEDNEIIVQDFLEVQGNREIDDKQFEFIVPAGAHPMDATSDAISFFKSIE
jgi:outer membrane lipoprotein-sorting protein